MLRKLSFLLMLLLSVSLFAAKIGELTGKVTDQNGKPVAGAVITIKNTKLNATTAKDGSYSLKGVSVGKYNISCSKEECNEQTITDFEIKGKKSLDFTLEQKSAKLKSDTKNKIAGKVEDVKLSFSDSIEVKNHTGQITGKVTDTDGQPIKDAEVTLIGTAFRTETDAGGSYSFHEIPVGEYQIITAKKQYKTGKQKQIYIKTGQFSYAEFTLEKEKPKTGKLAGRVKDNDGKPVSFANVRIMDGTRIVTGAQTKENGSYIVINIPPGPYDVLCSQVGYQTSKRTSVVINVDETSIQNFTLNKASLSIEGYDVTEAKVETVSKIKTGSGATITSETIEDVAVSDIKGLTAIQAGAAVTDDELHVRSGRADEVGYTVEGMSVSDPKKKEIHTIETTTLDAYEACSDKDVAGESVPKDKPSYRKTRSISGLQAGFVNDNQQYNYFLNFLEKYWSQVHCHELDVSERILLRIQDKNEKGLSDANVKIYAGKKLLEEGKSYADGSYFFYPSEYADSLYRFTAVITHEHTTQRFFLDRQDLRKVDCILANNYKQTPQNLPLDLLFIMDTTGSMGEEIQRLKDTIEIINLNLSSVSPTPDIRFGMVLYKDVTDSYVTRIIPFTSNLEEFQAELNKVTAAGGGDGPEDLQSALQDGMTKMQWRQNGVKMGFIITDAAPHLDYNQDYTYVAAAHDARKMGIKLVSIGTGGLNIMGEYILRQISQYTYSNYVFLTYGEKGESDGGTPGSVSHHTGDNFQTDKLEAIVIRLVKDELNHYLGKPLEKKEEYFLATRISGEKPKETLDKLFEMAISQLYDYSSINIQDEVPAAVVPIATQSEEELSNAEYFTANLMLALSRDEKFKAIERNNIKQLIEEQKLQISGFTNVSTAVKVGEIIGAEMIIIGELYCKEDNFELYLKLLKVETAEVLAVTKTRIDRKLGL